MADYEQLIKKLRTEALDSRKAVLSIYDLCIDAADKIENLISENAALRRQIDNLTSAQAMIVKEFDKKLEELHDTKSELDKFRKAEQDGRLVVLPLGTDVELERNGYTFKADHWNHSLTAFRDAPETKSGKQVALFSIEEAEAALKGGEG